MYPTCVSSKLCEFINNNASLPVVSVRDFFPIDSKYMIFPRHTSKASQTSECRKKRLSKGNAFVMVPTLVILTTLLILGERLGGPGRGGPMRRLHFQNPPIRNNTCVVAEQDLKQGWTNVFSFHFKTNTLTKQTYYKQEITVAFVHFFCSSM